MKRGSCLGAATVVIACLNSDPVFAQGAETSMPTLTFGALEVRSGLEAGIQVVTEGNAFWNLADTFSPTVPFDADPTWGEGYLKPSLDFTYSLDGGSEIYGRLSGIYSFTLGTDVFDSSEESEFSWEDYYLGIRGGSEQSFTFDLSVGAQRYQIGNGLLISDGSGDGFERGAVIFGPRRAFEETAIARFGFGKSRVDLFYVDANELESSDTKTAVAGAAFQHETAQGAKFGIAYGQVVESDAPWPQAAPGGVGVPSITVGARENLEFVNLWGSVQATNELSFAGDVALQWNDDQDMRAWGGRVQATYAPLNARFQPRFSYTLQAFSGDDTSTSRNERFDPLFYDGSPAGFASGGNAALVFINSNVMTHQLSVAMNLSPRDFFTARYYHVRAMELNSPLQFGQATRLVGGSAAPKLVSGVSDAHLSDDLYFEYTRVITPKAFLTTGIAVSFPGEGVRDLRGGEDDVWPGAYINLVYQF